MFKMSWLLSPWLILTGVISGVLIGINDTELAAKLLPDPNRPCGLKNG